MLSIAFFPIQNYTSDKSGVFYCLLVQQIKQTVAEMHNTKKCIDIIPIVKKNN